ncbi:MAG: hypothetical protein EZS28_021040, partial [Streblomastix strix]
RGSSPSLEEVMHDLKGHAISSEREVSSTFVPPVLGSPARKKKKKKKNQKDGAPTCPKSVSVRGEGKEQQQNRKRKRKKESE